MINLNTNHEKISHISKCFLQNGVESLLFTNNTLYVLLFSGPTASTCKGIYTKNLYVYTSTNSHNKNFQENKLVPE